MECQAYKMANIDSTIESNQDLDNIPDPNEEEVTTDNLVTKKRQLTDQRS